jgi:hypothetical protein
MDGVNDQLQMTKDQRMKNVQFSKGSETRVIDPLTLSPSPRLGVARENSGRFALSGLVFPSSMVEVVAIKPALQALGSFSDELTSPLGFAKITSALWAF